jgi:CheY-like chemotaxis protein
MKRVLVVEDSEPCLRICRIVLTHAGFDVDEARSAMEAIVAIRERLPDKLVCDLLLGRGRSGYDVVTEFRQAGGTGCAVAVTALIQPEVEQRARNVGFDAFLLKPYAPHRLVDLLSGEMSRKSRS